MRTGPLIATLALVARPTLQDRPDEPSRRLELSPEAIRLDGEWLVEPAPGLERWAAEIVRVRILDHDQERIELRIDPATRWGVVREVFPWLRRDEVRIDGRLVAPPIPSGPIEWATLRVDADRVERPEGGFEGVQIDADDDLPWRVVRDALRTVPGVWWRSASSRPRPQQRVGVLDQLPRATASAILGDLASDPASHAGCRVPLDARDWFGPYTPFDRRRGLPNTKGGVLWRVVDDTPVPQRWGIRYRGWVVAVDSTDPAFRCVVRIETDGRPEPESKARMATPGGQIERVRQREVDRTVRAAWWTTP